MRGTQGERQLFRGQGKAIVTGRIAPEASVETSYFSKLLPHCSYVQVVGESNRDKQFLVAVIKMIGVLLVRNTSTQVFNRL